MPKKFDLTEWLLDAEGERMTVTSDAVARLMAGDKSQITAIALTIRFMRIY